MPRVIFVSNYFNHHQAPFANAMDLLTEHQFTFVETIPMDTERKQMGWGQERKPGYVFQAYERELQAKAKNMILEADAVIWGSCPFDLIKPRLKAKKLTFAYSERLFKEGKSGLAYWGRVVKYKQKLGRYQYPDHYLLCASAYAASDYNSIGLFKGRTLKWGYFPELKEYNISDLMSRKISAATAGWKHPKASILWAGRLIGWKHPDASIKAAYELKKKGYSFQLDIIGNGEMGQQLQQMIRELDLSACVTMLGAMPPEKVREHMEKADIFLFTSDQNEGWGAVLNESMNSGCVVIANQVIGSVPYLVRDGENGFVVKECNLVEEIVGYASRCMEDHQMMRQMGEAAYRTIRDEWNAQKAAEHLQRLVKINDNELQGVCEKHESNSGIGK